MTKPHDTIRKIFEILPVEVETSVYKLYNSKASIHCSNHPNREILKRNFITTYHFSMDGRYELRGYGKDQFVLLRKCEKIQ